MGYQWRVSRLRAWSRLGMPVLLLLVGALMSGWIAWREAERAHRTGQMLMKDYASFVADKFVRISATRYMALVGISNPITDAGLPFNLLRAYANARQPGIAAKLPFPPT